MLRKLMIIMVLILCFAVYYAGAETLTETYTLSDFRSAAETVIDSYSYNSTEVYTKAETYTTAETAIAAAVLNNLSDCDVPSPTDGYVLTWDEGTSKWTAEAAGGGTSYWEKSGTVIRSNSVEVTYSTDDFVFGSPQLDDDGNTDHDARMFFDKSKGAFRAGQITGTQWDGANIGVHSVALGYNSLSSSEDTFAVHGTASGDYSISIGPDSSATDSYTTAVGYGAVATADYATAVGESSTATGAQSVAIGSESEATGYKSFAAVQSTATGTLSVAFSHNVASGLQSFAIGGGQATASGEYSGAIGLSAITFDVSQANTMAIMGGKVGIGTTTPGVSLEVAGTIQADTFEVGSGFIGFDGTNLTLSDGETGTKTLAELAGGTSYWDADGDSIVNNNAGTVEIGTAEIGDSFFSVTTGINKGWYTGDGGDTTFTSVVVGPYPMFVYSEASGNSSVQADETGVDINTTFAGGTIDILGNTKITGTLEVTDTIEAKAFHGGSGSFDIYEDGSDNLTFADSVTGAKTLAELAAGGGGTSYWEKAGTVIRSNSAEVTYSTDDFVFGSPQLDDDGNTDHDARMFFDKSKSAFRAGRVTGNEWNDANIGSSSTSFGYNTKASGDWGSIAVGNGCIASGQSAIAMGDYCTATNTYSIAMGTQSQATNIAAIALGFHSIASGTGAFACGENMTVSGSRSHGINLDHISKTLSQANTMAIMGGKVGIADLTPEYELDVTGDINFTGNLREDGNIVSIPVIKSGTVEIAVKTMDGYGTAEVSFNTSFSSSPIVVVTPGSPEVEATTYPCYIYDVTTSSCKIKASGGAEDDTLEVYWMAVGASNP